MGAASLLTDRAGTIRRVVRRGSTFICGLCRRHYDDVEEAKNCVGHCWDDLLSLDPVIVKPRFRAAVFRCRFCARDFAKRDLARACAQECRERHVERLEWERTLEDEDDGPITRRPRPRPVLAQPRREPPKPKARPKVEAPPPPAAPAPVDAVPIAADAVAPAAEEPAEKKKKKKGEEAFHRDGAQYVCNYCSAKYFTKVEVQKCFDGHE